MRGTKMDIPFFSCDSSPSTLASSFLNTLLVTRIRIACMSGEGVMKQWIARMCTIAKEFNHWIACVTELQG